MPLPGHVCAAVALSFSISGMNVGWQQLAVQEDWVPGPLACREAFLGHFQSKFGASACQSPAAPSGSLHLLCHSMHRHPVVLEKKFFPKKELGVLGVSCPLTLQYLRNTSPKSSGGCQMCSWGQGGGSGSCSRRCGTGSALSCGIAAAGQWFVHAEVHSSLAFPSFE